MNEPSNDVEPHSVFIGQQDAEIATMIARSLTDLLNTCLNTLAPLVGDRKKLQAIAALVTRHLHIQTLRSFGIAHIEHHELDFDRGLDEMLNTPPPSGKGD